MDVQERYYYEDNEAGEYRVHEFTYGDWMATWIDSDPNDKPFDSFYVKKLTEVNQRFTAAIDGDLDEMLAVITALRDYRDRLRKEQTT